MFNSGLSSVLMYEMASSTFLPSLLALYSKFSHMIIVDIMSVNAIRPGRLVSRSTESMAVCAKPVTYNEVCQSYAQCISRHGK